MYNSRDIMCDNSVSHVSSRDLNSMHPYKVIMPRWAEPRGIRYNHRYYIAYGLPI